MVSPTGSDVQDVITTIAADAWVAIDNPNMSRLVNMTATLDIYVKFQCYEPAVGEVTFPLWDHAYLTEAARKWLGHNSDQEAIPLMSAIWVRPITPGATGVVYSHFRRE